MTGRPLQGRRVFFLGAEGARGRSVAVAMGEAGAAVALVTLSRETQAEFRVNSIANEFWAFGGAAVALTCDLLDPDALRASLAEASARLGPPRRVDVIVTDVLHGPGAADAAPAVEAFAGFARQATEGHGDLTVVVLLADGAGREGYQAAEGLLRLVASLNNERRARACAVVAGEDVAEAVRPLMPQERLAGSDIGAAVVSAIERGLSGVAMVLGRTSP